LHDAVDTVSCHGKTDVTFREGRAMSDVVFPDDLSTDEKGVYLRLYLDETGEQLDALVQTLLALEANPSDSRQLDEAFRLLHSIKGSSALLGIDRITSLTHHLESHFVHLRSGKRTLDAATMNVVLHCIDFLRECNEHLRKGELLESAGELLDQVRALEHATAPPHSAAPVATASVRPVATASADARLWRITVYFAPGLQMPDLKAELILARLAAVGDVLSSIPPRDLLASTHDLAVIDIKVRSAAERATIEAAANADGVQRLVVEVSDPEESPVVVAVEDQAADASPPEAVVEVGLRRGEAAAPLTETLRIDIDRLDVLLNLAGELLVNRARFSQVVDTIGQLFQKSAHSDRLSLITDSLNGVIHTLDHGVNVDLAAMSQELTTQLEVLKHQTHTWNEGRHGFTELVAAVDQLTRVSQNLQQVVLSTRMVPVGPLFSRFKRSVRDMANELGKKVSLELLGEKTELDKRIIDELGDPLNHLIRNSIDHGIESTDIRVRHGKPETATVRMTASHQGNNVIITVEDDGGGIDIRRVRQTAIDRGLLRKDEATNLDEAEILEFIWEPGFSTKSVVSNVSGRGVGMDIVRTRVRQLNGSIEVTSIPGVGTTFSIRLPLTLAITRCMLFQLPQAVFAAPIENVREIVRLADHRTVNAHGRELCDIRGEFLPLFGMEDLFRWSGVRHDSRGCKNVVVLQSQNRAIGLRVDMLLGGHDIVVKPLDESYSQVRGLGGASILGDGSVCLLLDVATCVELTQLHKTAKRGFAEALQRPSSDYPAPNPGASHQ
jgi:two-component system chemotaxis sensor kinase CheA